MKPDRKKKHGVPSRRERDRADELVPCAARRPGGTTLAFPVGEPDLDGLRSVTREWLVPILVEKFLREHGIELRARPNTGPGKPPISDL